MIKKGSLAAYKNKPALVTDEGEKITIQAGPTVRQAPFAVLRSSIPGALVELGHLSNRDEEKLLNSAAHQNKLVSAIVKSISGYNFDV